MTPTTSLSPHPLIPSSLNLIVGGFLLSIFLCWLRHSAQGRYQPRAAQGVALRGDHVFPPRSYNLRADSCSLGPRFLTFEFHTIPFVLLGTLLSHTNLQSNVRCVILPQSSCIPSFLPSFIHSQPMRNKMYFMGYALDALCPRCLWLLHPILSRVGWWTAVVIMYRFVNGLIAIKCALGLEYHRC